MEIKKDDSCRKGESMRAPFRSGRFFSVGGKWFFSTREGKDHGPFDSKERAEAELQMFLRCVAGASEEEHRALDPWGRMRG